MRRQLISALRMTICLTVLLGLVYPVAVWAVSQVAFHHRANGSLIKNAGGVTVGSSLIGQQFVDAAGNPDPRYFQPRPSAAGKGYDATASGGSNLGPTNSQLVDALVPQRVQDYRTFNGLSATTAVPVDAVTASGSGLDPDISPDAAYYQVPRVARSRGLPEAEVRKLVSAHVTDRQLFVFGEPRVNVVDLNRALDALATDGAASR